jgi:hypothetical protein
MGGQFIVYSFITQFAIIEPFEVWLFPTWLKAREHGRADRE